MNSILILCGGHPLCCDDGVGYHVYQQLLQKELPENVECCECGYSASEVVWVIDGKDKMIFVDAFRSDKFKPGTVLKMRPEEMELTPQGKTDVPKMHLLEILDEIKISGKCPETLLMGLVPVEINKKSEALTPEIEAKIPELVAQILDQVQQWCQETPASDPTAKDR